MGGDLLVAVEKLPVATSCATVGRKEERPRRRTPPVCVEHLLRRGMQPVSLDTTQRAKINYVLNDQYTCSVSSIIINNLFACHNN